MYVSCNIFLVCGVAGRHLSLHLLFSATQAGVSDAVVRFDLSGAFLVDAPSDELEDFLLSRCPALAGVQRRRILFELDCMKRREQKEAEKICNSSNSSDEKESTHASSDDECEKEDTTKKFQSMKERWRDEGSKYLGAEVERLVWDELGLSRIRARGKIVAWCSAKDSTFLDDKGRKAPLWRAAFDSINEVVELEEHEVIAAIAEHEASIVEDAVRKVEQASKRRQRLAASKILTTPPLAPPPLPLTKRPRFEVAVVSAPPSSSPPPPLQPLKVNNNEQPKDASGSSHHHNNKKRGRPRKAIEERFLIPASQQPPASSSLSLEIPPSKLPLQLPTPPPKRHSEATLSLRWHKKPRLEMLTTSEAYDGVRPALELPKALPKAVDTVHQQPPPPSQTIHKRPRRSLAGRRACRGCHHTPCARSHAACFVGVESANGKYIAKADPDHTRFATALEAARRYDMLDKGANFEADDHEQLLFEHDFVVKHRLEAPSLLDNGEEQVHDGAELHLNGRTWYVCKDEDTLAEICAARRLDLDAILAANLRCAHFKAGPKLTPRSKLKRHTRVLLSV